MTADADLAVVEALGDRAHRDVPIGPMTTYRVGGAARWFVAATKVDDLGAVARARQASGLPVLVIGRGSNMLVSDRGFDGIALSIADLSVADRPAIDIDHQAAVVTVAGGVLLPVAARRSAAAGLTGFEWAVGVPGSIGGAVRMNAGGHGSDMAACVRDVDVFDLDRPGTTVTRGVDELGLSFRASTLAPTMLVLGARLSLSHGDRATSESLIGEIVRWRRAHQPGGQNCGSVFVNPVPGEVASGALIDRLGLRGFRIGTAWVSEKHDNFIQAGESGSADDVRAVIEHVRRRVADETGYALRSEVRLVGFDDVDPASFDDQHLEVPAR